MNAINKKVVALLRENYDVADADLKKKIDSECDRYLESVGASDRFSQGDYSGADSSARLRRRRIVVSFNDEEFAQVLAAICGRTSTAAGVREMALLGASATLNALRKEAK